MKRTRMGIALIGLLAMAALTACVSTSAEDHVLYVQQALEGSEAMSPDGERYFRVDDLAAQIAPQFEASKKRTDTLYEIRIQVPARAQDVELPMPEVDWNAVTEADLSAYREAYRAAYRGQALASLDAGAETEPAAVRVRVLYADGAWTAAIDDSEKFRDEREGAMIANAYEQCQKDADYGSLVAASMARGFIAGDFVDRGYADAARITQVRADPSAGEPAYTVRLDCPDFRAAARAAKEACLNELDLSAFERAEDYLSAKAPAERIEAAYKAPAARSSVEFTVRFAAGLSEAASDFDSVNDAVAKAFSDEAEGLTSEVEARYADLMSLWDEAAFEKRYGKKSAKYTPKNPQPNVCLLVVSGENGEKFSYEDMASNIVKASGDALRFTRNPDFASVVIYSKLTYPLAGTYSGGGLKNVKVYNSSLTLSAVRFDTKKAIGDVNFSNKYGTTITVTGSPKTVYNRVPALSNDMANEGKKTKPFCKKIVDAAMKAE